MRGMVVGEGGRSSGVMDFESEIKIYYYYNGLFGVNQLETQTGGAEPQRQAQAQNLQNRDLRTRIRMVGDITSNIDVNLLCIFCRAELNILLATRLENDVIQIIVAYSFTRKH